MKHTISLTVSVAFAMALSATMSVAQERDGDPSHRDFSQVQRARVVCSQQHYGRVQDLVADVPSGRIVTAVVAMNTDQGTRQIAVPYDKMTYDARNNLLRLEPCPAEDESYPVFDPTKVKVTGTGEGEDAQLAGTVLVSRLARARVALQGEATAVAQGLTVELASGHVAFVDLGREAGAGDADLHPVPWAALRFAADATENGKDALLALEKSEAELGKAPNLIQIIVQDPLRRAMVYRFFGVAAPEWDQPAK